MTPCASREHGHELSAETRIELECYALELPLIGMLSAQIAERRTELLIVELEGVDAEGGSVYQLIREHDDRLLEALNARHAFIDRRIAEVAAGLETA